ncbi:MAG TPA: hypothetical protein PK156_26305 [Polyangium sp.]|nr:hypothetical protein [Polyangium sp.]
MRQAFVNGWASAVLPNPESYRRRLGFSRCAFVHLGLPFAFGVFRPKSQSLLALGIAAGLSLASTSAFADPESKAPAPPENVSPAKPSVVSPQGGGKQQAKNFVSVGPIFGFTSHIDSEVTGALGLELSYVRYPYAAFGFGMGGFVQAQTVGLNHARYAFGPQFNFMMFGAEVGAYVEEGTGARAMTVGVHASPFVSLGFFSAALRLAVPIGTLNAGQPYGIDLGLVCALKVPIPLDGQLFGLAFH